MIHQQIAVTMPVKVQKTNFEIINRLQRNLHLLGVEFDGFQALFSLFRQLMNFLSKGIARLRKAWKNNLTFFGVQELLAAKQLLLKIAVADNTDENIGYQFLSLSMGVL